jgi:hypothetical protein
LIFDYSEARGRSTLLRSGLQALREKGLRFVAPLALRWATFPVWRAFRSHETFQFRGRDFHYFLHNYNITWANERAVEIPVAMHHLQQGSGRRVLEVGNVLSRYFASDHTVVDKYDSSPGVLNLDVATDDLGGPYDLIVTVSTLEHVGWDEQPRERGKVVRALANLERHLARGGTLFVTVPLGYSDELDGLIDSGEFRLDEQTFLRKLSGRNDWVVCTREETRGCRYNDRWPGASAILIGTTRKAG